MWMWWAISRFSHYSYISLLPAVCFYWFSLFTVVTIITLQSLVGLHFLFSPPWRLFFDCHSCTHMEMGYVKCPVLCIKCSRRLSWRALHVLCDLDDWGLMMIRKLKRQILTFAGFPLIKRHLTHTSDVSAFDCMFFEVIILSYFTKEPHVSMNLPLFQVRDETRLGGPVSSLPLLPPDLFSSPPA